MKRMVLLLGLGWSAGALAQSDDLEEAQGLPDEKPVAKEAKAFALPEGLTERSYIWVEEQMRKAARGDWQDAVGPNVDASISLNYRASASWQAFLDGRYLHNADPVGNRGVLEQGGVRYQATDKLLVAVGKERSRKAPGLIVAPSDFLYAQENLPGQREQRTGIWQGRVAYQETGRSLEVLALPSDTLNEQGMPDKASRWQGWAARGYYQFANFDLQVSAGELRDGPHQGVSTQGIVGAFKLYAEAGWQDHGKAQLGGVEYQGSDTWSARAEYYHQEPAASRQDLEELWTLAQRFGPTSDYGDRLRPFLREHYAIASVSGMNLDDRWNLFATLIRGLDDRGYLGNARGEWLASDHQVVGLSLIALSEGDHQQFALRPFDRQLSLDWKFTF